MDITIEERVDEAEYRLDRLEALYGKFVIDVNIMLNRLGKEIDKLKDEMKEFKNEMKEFKDEMKEYKDWSKNQIKEMNKQWGAMANKLGTVVEDIIFPATRPLLKKFFNCDPDILSMNIERKKGQLRGEFDIIAVCNEKVFLIEVKSTPKKEYIDEFLKDKVNRFKKLFPEYNDKELVLIFGSLRIPENILQYLTKHKIFAMAYREWEYMDILNYEELSGGKNV